MLAVCGILFDQFTPLTRPLPAEVNTHQHTWWQRGIQSRGTVTNSGTHTERNLLWWSAYCLENKHRRTLLWPNLGCRSFRQPHTYSRTTQWCSVHPLERPANWRIETSHGGGDYPLIFALLPICPLCCFSPIPHPVHPTSSSFQNRKQKNMWPSC